MKLFEKFSAVFLLASLFVLPICSTLAADLTTLDGQIYKNISVIQTNKTFVMVKHSGGITVVSYRDMTEADKLLYGYNSGAGSTSTDSAQTTSPSQATTTAPIIKSITTNQLMAIMLKEGYAVEKDEDGDLLWKIDGEEAHIIFHSNTAFYLFAKYKKGSKTTSASVNDFNADSYAGTSWLDKNGYPRLSVPIDITGGVTIERIRDHLKNCRDVFKDWLSTVVD